MVSMLIYLKMKMRLGITKIIGVVLHSEHPSQMFLDQGSQ